MFVLKHIYINSCIINNRTHAIVYIHYMSGVVLKNVQMEMEWRNINGTGDHWVFESPLTSSSSSSSLSSSKLSSSPMSVSSCSPFSSRSANYIEHTVSRFDTLAGVAIKYGVEVLLLAYMWYVIYNIFKNTLFFTHTLSWLCAYVYLCTCKLFDDSVTLIVIDVAKLLNLKHYRWVFTYCFLYLAVVDFDYTMIY